MMFCRSTRRHACVLIVALLACHSAMVSAATKTSTDPARIELLPAKTSDAAVDVRPVEFDPALLPAVTPSPVDHSLDPSSDKEATVIPLPPAAWTGMAGLVGLGLIRARHKLRRFLS
jgi:hypothetical protein